MLDERDCKLLMAMQRDCDTPLSLLAEAVNLSPSACSRRLARLKSEGFILRHAAIVDRDKLGMGATVFVLIKTAHHSPDWLEELRRALDGIGEIVEAHRLAGNLDYCLKVVVADIAHYDRVYKKLVSQVDLSDVSAYVSMEALKNNGVLPLRSGLL